MNRNQIKSKIKSVDALYNLYLFVFKHAIYVRNVKEKTFYRSIVKPKDLVFDIGANVGGKTKLFADLGAKVLSFEPDPTNYEILKNKFRNKKEVKILQVAVSNYTGQAKFYILQPGSAFNTLNIKWKEIMEDSDANRWHDSRIFQGEVEVMTTTIDRLISEYGKPAFIKIDVEGNELSCIEGLSQTVKVISFEANLPEFKNETLKILDHLNTINKDVLFNYMRNDESFEFENHLSYEDFFQFIRNTELRYMEIFSFMNYSNF